MLKILLLLLGSCTFGQITSTSLIQAGQINDSGGTPITESFTVYEHVLVADTLKSIKTRTCWNTDGTQTLETIQVLLVTFTSVLGMEYTCDALGTIDALDGVAENRLTEINLEGKTLLGFRAYETIRPSSTDGNTYYDVTGFEIIDTDYVVYSFGYHDAWRLAAATPKFRFIYGTIVGVELKPRLAVSATNSMG